MLHTIRRLLPYILEYKGRIAAGLALLIVANYLDVLAAVLIGSGVDMVAPDLGPLTGVQGRLLTIFLVLMLMIAVGSAVLRYFQRQWIIGASRHMEYDLRNRIFTHLLGQSPGYYDHFRTGDLISRATSDIEAVRVVLGPAIMYMANTLVMLPITMWQMLHISPALTGMVWAPMVLIAPMFYLFKRGIHERFRRTQELMSDLSANIQETMSGVRVIKVHAREGDRAELFNGISEQYVHENMRLARIQAIFIPMLGLIVGLAVLVLLWGGGWLIIHNRLTIGSLLTFFIMMMASIWPLIAFGWVLAQLERGSASWLRIEEVLSRQGEVQEHAETLVETPTLQGRIELRELTFTYPMAERPALQSVTLTVPAGSTLGLTGPVGCGKSTLAALLMRRYNPPRGSMLIDGVDLLDWPVEGLRRQIGIVDQEPFLFSDTIEANILFGANGQAAGAACGTPCDDPQEARRIAEAAAQTAQLAPEIASFPRGYETLLGERGINLSGGQRQRLALARALARDPGLLILDDALAAVDTQTEEAILRGLRSVLGGRTTILISHRISTVSLADRIVYLEAGRIIESGTHEELMAMRGAYYRLAQRQRLAEQIEQTA